MPLGKHHPACVLHTSDIEACARGEYRVKRNPHVKPTTAEPDVMHRILLHEVLVQAFYLLMHLIEGNVLPSVTEVLAVEITYEVSDDWSVVIDTMVSRRGERTVAVRREVDIATSILTPPVALEALPVFDQSPVSLLTGGAYLKHFPWEVQGDETHSITST